MNIPEKIKLGWRNYIIEQGEHRSGSVSGTDCYGEIAFENNKIYLYDKLSNDEKIVTLLHEIVHWIFYNSGHKEFRDDEELITLLSENLYHILDENNMLKDETE